MRFVTDPVTAILLGESQVDQSSLHPSLLLLTLTISDLRPDSYSTIVLGILLQYFDGEGSLGADYGGDGGWGDQAVQQQ